MISIHFFSFIENRYDFYPLKIVKEGESMMRNQRCGGRSYCEYIFIFRCSASVVTALKRLRSHVSCLILSLSLHFVHIYCFLVVSLWIKMSLMQPMSLSLSLCSSPC